MNLEKSFVKSYFSELRGIWPKIEFTKVRYVARIIYGMTSRAIGLNVVYLLMLNRHDTTNVRERKRGRGKAREKECAHNGERGVP